ncbi:DUF2381 family protein [Corallococcus sp. AB050B]|nr:DUF2381 family protein [Corallococcus sp. AB050B]
MPSLIFAALLGVLLASGAAVAQSELPASTPGVRRIELASDDVQATAEIVISPGLSTTFLFDSDLNRNEVELESRDRFALVDMGQTTLRLVPSSRLSAGDRFRLVVHFRDGAAPVSASFLLRVHSAKAESLIEVYRGKRTIETYQHEVREVRTELARCLEENARFTAERDAPDGLAGLLATSSVDEGGVRGRVVTKEVAQTAGSEVNAKAVVAYRFKKGIAVEITLKLKSGAQPWFAKGAMLRSKAGTNLKVMRVWQDQPLTLGEFSRVVVEAETPGAASGGTFTLKLWEEDGPRAVTLGNVTFP